MAAVVATIARFAAREFSVYHGAAVLAVFCLSPMLLERAFTAYWTGNSSRGICGAMLMP
jgi:hypothetical protein